MSTTSTGGELANIEIRRLSSVAWVSISLFYSGLALTAQSPIVQWQIYFAIGALVTLLVSMLLQIRFAFDFSYTPIILYLLISPILLGNTPEKPWMSYGLLTLTANLYIASVARRNIAIVSMAAVTIFQIWVISLNLTSFSDLTDMKLLDTYFSSLWTFGTGLAFMIIRERYLLSSEKIEVEILKIKDQISSRLQNISLRNRNDYRNLQLHGTILNTLIYAKNNPDFLRDRRKMLQAIQKEIFDLRSETRIATGNLKAKVENLISERTRNRIRVSQINVLGQLNDNRVENNILEILREILLNLEKHTSVAEVQIQFSATTDGNFLLRISESAHFDVSSQSLEERKSASLRSESLNRLLSVTPSQLAISTTPDGFGLIYTVTNLQPTSDAVDPREILRLRNSSLIEFAQNLGKATALFGLVFLPGYFFLNIRKDVLALLTLHALVIGFTVIYRSQSRLWLSFSTFLSLAIPLVVSQGSVACLEIAYLPWLLNIVLMSAFIFATQVKNRFLRWVPITIITLELFLLPRGYPDSCKDIFLGSTPAVPLIIAFAIVLNSLRNRLYIQDSQQISSVFEDDSNVIKYEDALEVEFEAVISELEKFAQNFLDLQDIEISEKTENQIQKIRAFLVSSEQFESEIIRKVYSFVRGRLSSGISTRLNILGDFFYQLDSTIDSDLLISHLNQILDSDPCEITFIQLQNLKVEIAVDSASLQSLEHRASTVENRVEKVQFAFIAR